MSDRLRPRDRHRAEALASTLPPLLVAAERVASTVALGVHGRRRTGQGERFWQFRAYQPGDSAQRIDWRESAKSQRIYVREREWEAAQSIWLWRDGSASMDYASIPSLPTKRAMAELLLVALASLLLRGGERAGLLGASLPPAGGRPALDRIVRSLDQERTDARARNDGPGSNAGLPGPAILPRFGQIVLFGDFLAPLDAVRETVRRFAAQGLKGHILQILDPAEETLPFQGRIRFEGMEEKTHVVFGRVESVRGDYAAALARHRAGIAAIARAAGWSFATERTDQRPHAALLALFEALIADAPPRHD